MIVEKKFEERFKKLSKNYSNSLFTELKSVAFKIASRYVY